MYNEEELELFTKNRESKYDRRNLCKKCSNKRGKERLKNSDEAYIKHVFYGMRKRCYKKSDIAYPDYGGRGIAICQEWLDNPKAFVDWALTNGFKRELWIDRIDNAGPYSPNNCRWITHSESNRNMRKTVTDFERETRICSRCKKEKPLTDFYRDKREAMGRKYMCKECKREKK